MYFCCGSFENAMSHADPEPSVSLLKNASFTNVPSGLNTWMRSFTRSQTYNSRSTERSAQCTGFRNCCAGGAAVPESRALRGTLGRSAVVCLRSRERPHPGVQAGRHVREGSVLQQGDARLGIGVGHRVLEGPAAEIHLP